MSVNRAKATAMSTVSQTLSLPKLQFNQPQPPLRNKSAFIHFSLFWRKKVREEGQEELNSNEMMIKVAELWRTLPKEEREMYEEQAKMDKERYYKELKVYEENSGDMSNLNKTKRNHVKKPCSCYGIFLRENTEAIRLKNPDMKMAELMKILSNEWKSLDEASKQKYKDIAAEEKELTNSENSGFMRTYKKKQPKMTREEKNRRRRLNYKEKKLKLKSVETTEEEPIEPVKKKMKKYSTSSCEGLPLQNLTATCSTVEPEYSPKEFLFSGAELLDNVDFTVFGQDAGFSFDNQEQELIDKQSLAREVHYSIERPNPENSLVNFNKRKNEIILDMINCDLKDVFMNRYLGIDKHLIEQDSMCL